MTAPDEGLLSGRRRPRHSIFLSTLLRLGLGLATVTLIGMAIAYFYVLSSMEERAIAELRAYIRERGAHEETIFALAKDNHRILKDAILRKLEARDETDPAAAFDRLFVRQTDGITRNRPELYDGTRMAGVCIIDPQLPLTADIQQRVLTFYELVSQFGPAWHNRFQDTYISTPENIMVIYWPEVPRWCQDTTTRLYMSIEEYQWVADAQHNPARETVWTGLFYDHISGNWVVTCATPVYQGDRQIATLGHDILLNELLDRALEERLKGTYNIVLRSDGRLIAHPQLMDEIERKGGYYDVVTMGDEHLRGVYETAIAGQEKALVVNHPGGNEFLAVAHLEGVDWYFVTVFPKSILADLAFSAARMVLLLGLLALLFQGLVLYWVIRRQVDAPLAQLMSATQRVEAGDYQVSLDIRRHDEFGLLSHAFNQMTARVRDRDRALADAARELDLRVKQRTAELEHAKEAAVHAAQEAELATRAKSAFLANMSHEIRTPMNAILGFTEILAGLVTDRQQQEYLRAVQSSGKSLLRLINDILDLSKVEAGKLELVYGAVNPRELFTEMEQIFSQKIAEKNLKLIIDIGPGLPPALLLDEVRLRQILVNLIGNAIKFTDQGHIRLSARSLYPEADHSTLDLVFEVEDTGMGIAKQQQEKVFGAFEQQSGQSLDKYGGTGLGLAITKRLVEIMGGEIHLGSTPGQGSTFHVTLKRVRVASVAELATHAVPAIDADTVSFSAATLLVVDDIAVNRSLIRGYLAQYGFGILEAANGQEAIEITRARQPDLILMDMRMPVLNGYEATRKIKQQPEIRQIPVIALTASAMAQDAKEITGLCDGYLRKPVSKPDLVAELIRFLPHSIAEPAPETVAGTAETPPWPPVSLDTGTRQRLAELLPVLQGQQERCDKLGKTMSINDIEAFALQMQQQGSDYGYPPLVSWGKRLADRAVMFDLNGIAETLDSFPHCIRELEAMLTG